MPSLAQFMHDATCIPGACRQCFVPLPLPMPLLEISGAKNLPHGASVCDKRAHSRPQVSDDIS